MAHNGCGGGIGIGAGDDLVAGADAHDAQRHFGTGGLGVQAHTAVSAGKGSNLTLQLLGLGTGGDPAGAECVGDFLDLHLGDIGRGKQNIHLVIHVK